MKRTDEVLEMPMPMVVNDEEARQLQDHAMLRAGERSELTMFDDGNGNITLIMAQLRGEVC